VNAVRGGVAAGLLGGEQLGGSPGGGGLSGQYAKLAENGVSCQLGKDFPLDEVKLRAKTGTAEVYGRQTTSWLATYTKDYVVVSMIEQAGTGSGAAGDAVRRIWEALYGIRNGKVHPQWALIPGTTPPDQLPRFQADGRIDPPDGIAEPTDERTKRGRR